MVIRLLSLLLASTQVAAAQEPARKPVRHVGVTFDLGAPDGLNLGIAWRPVDPVRFSVTAATNGIGGGGRVGVALKAPWDVAPVIAVEGGHFLEADANWVVGALGGEQDGISVLERVGYTFANAHGGLEFGNPKATFYIHGGMSGIWTKVRGLQAFVDKEADEGTLRIDDANIRAFVPSARFGFIIYFKGRSP